MNKEQITSKTEASIRQQLYQRCNGADLFPEPKISIKQA